MALMFSAVFLFGTLVGCGRNGPIDTASGIADVISSEDTASGSETQSGKQGSDQTQSSVVPSVSIPETSTSSVTSSPRPSVSSSGSSSSTSAPKPPAATDNVALRINSVADLQKLAKEVANGNTYQGKLITLEKNLDLSGINWEPIGTYEKPFRGNFDGKGHTVSNMTIEKQDVALKSTDVYTVGLFGFVFDGKISNVKLTDIDISLKNSGGGHGWIDVGGLVGCIIGNHTNIGVENCFVSGNISLETIDDTSLTAGGIAGDLTANYDHLSLDMKYLESRVNIDVAAGNSVDCGGIVGNLSLSKAGGEVCDLVYMGTLSRAKNLWRYAMGGICGGLNLREPAVFENCFISLNLPQIKEWQYSSYYYEGLVAGQETVSCKELTLKNVYASASFEGNSKNYEFVDKSYSDPVLENCERATTLPENSGFDKNKWNLSDLSTPRLK